MRSGEHEVARRYVLYREERARERAQMQGERRPRPRPTSSTWSRKGSRGRSTSLPSDQLMTMPARDWARRRTHADHAERGQGPLRRRPDGGGAKVRRSSPARSLIEKDPAYSFVTARLLLNTIRHEVLGEEVRRSDMTDPLCRVLPRFIARGSRRSCSTRGWGSSTSSAWARRWTPAATSSSATWACRPFTTVISCTSATSRIELPQAFFMRVAMGLALNEVGAGGTRDRVLRRPVVASTS